MGTTGGGEEARIYKYTKWWLHTYQNGNNTNLHNIWVHTKRQLYTYFLGKAAVVAEEERRKYTL